MALGNAAFGDVWKESWGRLVVSCREDWLGFVDVLPVSTQEISSFFVFRKKGSKI
jgi:hypothetical protein